MNTEEMIKELRRLIEIEKNKLHYTGDVRWDILCTDVSNRLEELNDVKTKIFQLNDNIDSLIDVANETLLVCNDEKEKIRLDGQIKAYWQAKHLVEDILTIKTIIS